MIQIMMIIPMKIGLKKVFNLTDNLLLLQEKVFTKIKMMKDSIGEIFMYKDMMQKKRDLSVTGEMKKETRNCLSNQELTFFLKLKIQLNLLKELLKLIKKEFILIL